MIKIDIGVAKYTIQNFASSHFTDRFELEAFDEVFKILTEY